jgi:hypothetical protein
MARLGSSMSHSLKWSLWWHCGAHPVYLVHTAAQLWRLLIAPREALYETSRAARSRRVIRHWGGALGAGARRGHSVPNMVVVVYFALRITRESQS